MKTLKLIQDFLWEKKAGIALYLLTVTIFVFVGSLYHMENMEAMLYAGFLTSFVWLVAGLVQLILYVIRRRNLTRALVQPTQAMELLKTEEGVNFPDGLEADYVKLIELLEQEIRRLTSRTEERRTEQNDYYVMWTHQIKTPIAALKLLTNDDFRLQEELFKIEQYVDMALHFQRLESMAADMVLEKYDLYTLLKKSVKKYSVLFINKNLSLYLEEMQIQTVTDEKWFGFCIEQILSNSIKYTGSGSISIYMDSEHSDTLVIADTGIGIRREDLPRIFERGFTGYNGRMDQKSTGIGLYLCKQILDRLGCGISYDSEEGQGTRVLLTLVTEDGGKLTKL